QRQRRPLDDVGDDEPRSLFHRRVDREHHRVVVERDVEGGQQNRSSRRAAGQVRGPWPPQLHHRHVSSLGAEFPLAQVLGLFPHLAAPPGHVEHEPEAHHDRKQHQDRDAEERDQSRDRHHDRQRHADHPDPHHAHVPHDPPVLLRRDLGGVPGAAALAADPPLAVRGVADIAAVAADGDLGATHARILGAGQGHEQAGRTGPGRKKRLLIRDKYRHQGASRAKQRSPGVNGGAQMAEAYVEERHLLKSLRWWDGFVIALCNPGFLFAALGFSMGALGTWGAVVLWAISAAVGMLQTWIYAESASMFPDKPGGISLYAHEGWRGRFSLAGPIAAYGYWIGWSVVLSIFGKIIGDLIQAEWFPNTTWSVFSGTVHLGLPHFIAIGAIIIVWLLNVFGIRPAVWITYLTGAGLMVPLAVVI